MEIDRPISIAVTLFIIIFVFFYFIFPEYENVKNLQAEILTREMELSGREDYFKGMVSIYNNLLERRENVIKINTTIPSSTLIPSLVYFLEEKSKLNNLALRDINLTTIRSSGVDEIKESRFSLNLRGNYLNFRRFLNSLENSSRLINIERIHFTQERENVYDFVLNIKTYSY